MKELQIKLLSVSSLVRSLGGKYLLRSSRCSTTIMVLFDIVTKSSNASLSPGTKDASFINVALRWAYLHDMDKVKLWYGNGKKRVKSEERSLESRRSRIAATRATRPW